MDVQDEAADRHRRNPAIVDEIIPIAITQLGDVAAKGFEQVERMIERKTARGEHCAKRNGFGRGLGLAEKAQLHLVEKIELFFRTRGSVVGDIVGGAREAIEAENDGAVARMNDPGRDGEVFVAMALSRF